MLFSFPDILLAIAIVAILGPGIFNVFIAVAVFTVPKASTVMKITRAGKYTMWGAVPR